MTKFTSLLYKIGPKIYSDPHYCAATFARGDLSMTENNLEEIRRFSIIGKSLAYVCLHLADLKNEGLAEQGNFLKRLGLTRRDAAGLLNTTEEALRVTEHRSKARKGARREKKKKQR